ncbi:hypothetical protein L6452_22384 [Arctium lappa]|uniref:Uncharacterized protein n=1 Tax=Arctium lappa TaxID=4217 RepID=A0ACB9AYT1_ARCLA|nr:hypothetical protein L6452_22384 [Arctium lappa]
MFSDPKTCPMAQNIDSAAKWHEALNQERQTLWNGDRGTDQHPPAQDRGVEPIANITRPKAWERRQNRQTAPPTANGGDLDNKSTGRDKWWCPRYKPNMSFYAAVWRTKTDKQKE